MTPEYIKAVDDFKAADRDYKDLENHFLSGEFIADEALRADFLTLVEQLRRALEDRNVKLQLAKNAMRPLVAIPETQWRGSEAPPAKAAYDGFEVSSVTSRTYDAETLLRACQQAGLLERLMQLTSFDKDNREYRLVEQKWSIDYAGVKNWLLQNGLQAVHTMAYDEREGTPRVTAPKPLAFLGDKKDGSRE